MLPALPAGADVCLACRSLAAAKQLPRSSPLSCRQWTWNHISIKTPLRQLSDGYKRRVALAVQLARQPSMLLLDEPLAGLDWKSRADVARVLGEHPRFAQTNKTQELSHILCQCAQKSTLDIALADFSA